MQIKDILLKRQFNKSSSSFLEFQRSLSRYSKEHPDHKLNLPKLFLAYRLGLIGYELENIERYLKK